MGSTHSTEPETVLSPTKELTTLSSEEPATAKEFIRGNESWDQDPSNPQNWTPLRKRCIIGLLASVDFLATLATSFCMPAAPQILGSFGSTNELYLPFIITAWELGEAVGPLLTSPLSELLGRAPIYHVSNILFLVFSAASALSPSIQALVVFRFFNGACIMVFSLEASVLGDIYPKERLGGIVALMKLPAILGLLLAPIIGAYVNQALGWRWIFWLTAIAGGAVELGFLFLFRETYKPAIQRSMSHKVKLKSNGGTPVPATSLTKDYPRLLRSSLLRPLKVVRFAPNAVIVGLYRAVLYGSAYVVNTMTAVVFEDVYKVNEGNVGLTFLGFGLGMVLGVILCKLVLDPVIKAQMAKKGETQPESRLYLLVCSGILMPAGFFLFGWTSNPKVPLEAPLVGTGMVSFSLILSSVPVITYLVDAFEQYSSSALAVMTLLQGGAAALIPLAGPALYNNLGLGWGNSVLGFSLIALLPVPLLLIAFGRRLRDGSPLERLS